MTENATKDCPYCAEPVKAQATICPHCRSTLHGPTVSDTYRNRPGRQIAGVSIALAAAFGISVTFVRLAFVVLTFVNFIGPVLYVALWLVLPAEPGGSSPIGRLVNGEEGEPSIFERVVKAIEELFDRVAAWFRSDPPKNPESSAERTP